VVINETVAGSPATPATYAAYLERLAGKCDKYQIGLDLVEAPPAYSVSTGDDAELMESLNAVVSAFATQHGFTWLLSRLAKPSDTFSIERIRAERLRQMTSEGWTAEHDDLFVNGELRAAAIAYAMACDDRAGEDVSNVWPWEIDWWKPSEDPIRNLEKAAALLAAEIDRLKRKEGRADG